MLESWNGKCAVITLTLLMLSGCATRPSDVSQSQRSAQIAQQQLNQLQQWSVSGKLAIITPTERKSAYLSWQQQNDSVTMTLTTIVGTTIAKLHYDGNIATLTADDQTWQDSSPSALIYRVTGWDVPVESLSHWMKGQVKRDVVSEYFDNGLVKQIRAECSSCLPWQINYSTYGEFILNEHLFTLPTAMRLTQALTQTRLILRIDSWKAEDV